MTTYAATEAALLTLCQGYNAGATFTAANTRRGEWTIFDAPYDASLVLVQHKDSRFGDQLARRGAQGKQQEEHHIAVEVYYRRLQGQGGDGARYTALLTLRDGLQAWISRYPRLNNAANVKRAEVVTTTPPALAGASPQNAATHWMTELHVTVQCEVALTNVESIQ